MLASSNRKPELFSLLSLSFSGHAPVRPVRPASRCDLGAQCHSTDGIRVGESKPHFVRLENRSEHRPIISSTTRHTPKNTDFPSTLGKKSLSAHYFATSDDAPSARF